MSRRFYALLISQTATNLSFALYIMAVIMHLHEATGSTALAAAATLTSLGARMASGLLLPAFAGRLTVAALIRISQLAQLAFLAGLLPLVRHQPTGSSMAGVFLLMAVVSFCSGFFTPLKSTMVKHLVAEPERVRANSLLASVDQTFLFAGWTFGGVLLSWAGQDVTLGIAMGLIVISIASFPATIDNGPTAAKPAEDLTARLTSGWRQLFQQPDLRTLVIMDMAEAFTGTIWIGAVTLAFVMEALGQDETWWGYINGAYYLGTFAGGLLAYRLSRFLNRHLTGWMLLGSLLFGLLTFWYGWVSNPWLALGLVLLTGPCYQVRDIAQETLYQNRADEQDLPNLLAARHTLLQLIFMISVITVGVLTDLIGVRLVYIGSGALLMLTAWIAWVRLRIHRKKQPLGWDTPGSLS